MAISIYECFPFSFIAFDLWSEVRQRKWEKNACLDHSSHACLASWYFPILVIAVWKNEARKGVF